MREGTGEQRPIVDAAGTDPRDPTKAPGISPSWTADLLSHDPLESLRLVAAELAGSVSLDGMAAAVAKVATGALDAQSIVVGIWDEVGRHVDVVHESGLSDAARQQLPTALDAASGVLQTDGRAVVERLDSVAEALVADISSPDPGPRALAALMPPDERPLGIVFVGRANGGAFSHEDRRFLEALAAVCALALERLLFASEPRRPGAPVRAHDHDMQLAGSHIQVGDMDIDLGDQEVVLGDRRAHLTPSELRILLFLAAAPGRARTRREILQHLWHSDHVGDERACDAHISNLRRKLERDPSRPNRVVTVRGVGYALRRSRNGA